MGRPCLLALILSVTAVLPIATSEPISAATAGLPASRITRSFYMANASKDAAVVLGCRNGDKQGRMTLFFGAPTAVGSSYGATLWGAPNRTAAQIGAVAKSFARGYVYCRRSSSYRLVIGIGTSNSTIDSHSTTWLENHGKTWATMVNQLAAWANLYYPNAVQFYAAWDAEPSWSTYDKANAWMHGYDYLYPKRRALYANFSADGCPTTTATNGPCNNGWSQARVWHLAWQHDPSLTFPQIYATNGANAKQWQLIDEWATRHRADGITFYGAVTQYGACSHTRGGCPGTDNTPEEAYNLLLWYLNTSPYTSQSSLGALTDMNWHS